MGNTSVALTCREEALPPTSGVVVLFEVEDFAAATGRTTAFRSSDLLFEQ